MGVYARPICIECNRWMQLLESEDKGVAIHVGVHNGHFHADIYTCSQCGVRIVMKWADAECFCSKKPYLHIE